MKFSRTLGLLLISVLTLSTLAGCWGIQEIDERAYVLAMAVDELNSGEIEVTVFMPIPEKLAEGKGTSGGGGSEGPPFFTASGTGKTVAQAYSRIRYKSKYRPYLGHLGVVIFSDKVARKGLESPVDFLERNFEVNRNIVLIVARDKASNLLEVEVSAEPNLADYYKSFFEEENLDDAKFNKDLGLYLVEQADPGQDSALPYMTTTKDQGQNVPKLLGAAVIKNGKMVGQLTEDEVRGYALATSRTRTGILTVTGFGKPGEYATVEIGGVRPQYKINVQGQNISVDFTARVNITAYEFTGRELNEDFMPKIEEAVNKRLKQDFEAAFAKAKTLNADIFGIGKRVYYKHNNVWNKITWDAIFPTIPVNVSVKSRLSSLGATK